MNGPPPQAGRLFDHGGTVFFSVFMALWAVLFLEYWKRTSATLAYRWGCSDYEDIEERPRPQFAASAPTTALNPVTGEEEPHFPRGSRMRRTLAGSVLVLMMVAAVVMCFVSITVYRTTMAVLVSRSNNTLLATRASRIASLTGSVVNLVFILTISKVYVALAHVLTRWEMHRTQTSFEDAFTLKVFIFQFVNFYSSPIYIGFFKGRFVGYPGNYHTLFGVRNEECAAGGCLVELAQELLVIMVGKQIINNMQEMLVPKLKGRWLRSKKGKVASAAVGQAPWEADYELLPYEGLFDEYLEMVLQFGFVTLFAAACPLAPLFAMLNNWLEIRLDAQKLVCGRRRPVAERAQDVGIWFPILAAIAHLAVTSNALLLAFSSDFLPRTYYLWARAGDLRGFVNFTLARAPPAFAAAHNRTCRYRAFRDHDGHYSGTYWNLLAIRLAFVIVFEHVVFSIGRVLDLLVPDIPESVQIKVKREYYLAKQALAENETLFGTNGAKDDQPQSSAESLGPQPRWPEASRASPVPSL